MRPRLEERADAIIDVVLDLLEHDGYDAVQVREIAHRAHVSLATLYKLFTTRDEMIIDALERWMDTRVFPLLPHPQPNDAPFDVMVGVVNTMFEHWEQHPRMLAAYWRARSGPGGERLERHGVETVTSLVDATFHDADSEYLEDVHLIHSHVLRAAVARFARGEIEISEILALSRRTLYRLTTDNRPESVRGSEHVSRRRSVSARGSHQRS